MKIEKCPMCKQLSSAKFEPFCSENCANKDLGNWLTGKYYIPGEKVNDEKAAAISFDISQKIQNEMTYPGQVKVTVIRETRAVNYAK